MPKMRKQQVAKVPEYIRYLVSMVAYAIEQSKAGVGDDRLSPTTRQKVERRRRLGLPVWCDRVRPLAQLEGLSLEKDYENAGAGRNWPDYWTATQEAVQLGLLVTRYRWPAGIVTTPAELERTKAVQGKLTKSAPLPAGVAKIRREILGA
jgi:hypothetical protein